MVTITIGHFTVKAEVASTREQLTTGLSNRERLAYDEGLLLVLPKEGRIPITMKDMRFPIDVLFFDNDFKFIQHQDLFPNQTLFKPLFPWRFALEIKLFSGGKFPRMFAHISDGPSIPSLVSPASVVPGRLYRGVVL